jgi:hypothetical protein
MKWQNTCAQSRATVKHNDFPSPAFVATVEEHIKTIQTNRLGLCYRDFPPRTLEYLHEWTRPVVFRMLVYKTVGAQLPPELVSRCMLQRQQKPDSADDSKEEDDDDGAAPPSFFYPLPGVSIPRTEAFGRLGRLL